VIVEFLLHFVEVAVPLLVRKARVPAARAVIIAQRSPISLPWAVNQAFRNGSVSLGDLVVLVTESATAAPFGDGWPAEQTLRLPKGM
jgi:hypothetical protein